MPINTLTDLNNLITNGSPAERLAFKNIIVNGLNAQDLADIITSSTRAQKEALAVLVIQAENFLGETNKIAREAQEAIDVAAAQSWFDGLPQFATTPSDHDTMVSYFNNLISLINTETDRYRLRLLRKKIAEIPDKTSELKLAGTW